MGSYSKLLIAVVALSVIAMALFQKFGGGITGRENIVERAEGEEIPASAPQVPAPAPAPVAAPVQAAPESQSTTVETNPAVDSHAVVSLTAPHGEEKVTLFDRSLLFLAPAAEAPQIVTPVRANVASSEPAAPKIAAESPVAPTERRWRGVVLVPKDMLLATAHTTLVRIPRIEAHPLDDGTIRIWVRIENPAASPVRVGASCTFRLVGEKAGASRGFQEIEIPAGRHQDLDFLSPHSGVETYTVLIRPSQDATRR